jgi:hypothetical protein
MTLAIRPSTVASRIGTCVMSPAFLSVRTCAKISPFSRRQPDCSATIWMRDVLPHPGMLPNGPSIASPECSRRVGILSIGAEPIMLKSLSMAAASMLNLASNLIEDPRVSDHAWR